MGLIKKYYRLVSVLSVAVCILAACTVSYKFNGASINYDKVKTISFENFPNRSAAFVWGPWNRCLIQPCKISICSKPV